MKYKKIHRNLHIHQKHDTTKNKTTPVLTVLKINKMVENAA